jgi:hypothetical protein
VTAAAAPTTAQFRRRIPWRAGGAIALVFFLLWGLVAPRLGDAYSPDSYGYLLLGRSVAADFHYASAAVRDLHGVRAAPQPSRSFPPVWPALLALVQRLTGGGAEVAVYAALAVLAGLVAAAWRLAGAIDGGRPGLLFLSLPLFFIVCDPFQNELAAGRAIPLTLFFLLLGLAGFARSLAGPPSRRLAALLGGGLALMFLTRYDQLPFCGLFALLLGFAWIRRYGWTNARRPLLALAGASALVWLPWGLRNLLVFGSPFATDNGDTARSLYTDLSALAWFAPGHAPGTLGTAPLAWLLQRGHYLKMNLRITFSLDSMGHGLWLAAVALGLASWRRLRTDDRWLLLAATLHPLAVLAAVTLTPFHDFRYFSSGVWLCAFVIALSLHRLSEPLPRLRLALLAAAALGLFAGPAVSTWHLFQRASAWHTALAPAPDPGAAYYAQITPRLQSLVPADALVATGGADPFAYYTGRNAIYLPRNCVRGDDPDFLDWLAAWRPGYIWMDAAWVERMGLGGWVIDAQNGMRLLRVPDAQRGTGQMKK